MAHLRHRHLHGHAAWERRVRVDAELDNIRTHTPPVTTAPVNEAEAARTSAEATQPTSLVPMPAPSRSNARDLPVFHTSVPEYMPVALRGSHEVLVHQNIIADVEGLNRIQNDEQLSQMVHSGDLVALPASSGLLVDPRLPANRRYSRPWTAKFLSDLSAAHESLFGHPLFLTSAVRTVEFQRHLAHYNGNAAPAAGDTASPHLTGEAIDLGKKGMSLHEIAWMRAILGQLQSSGKLDVEEEFEQACFHISVYKTYAPHSSLPPQLIAANAPAAADESIAEQVPSATDTIGAVQPVSETSSRPAEWHHTRAYSRRAVVRHRRHHHAATMSLLAARMR